jgi:hypothetical protein
MQQHQFHPLLRWQGGDPVQKMMTGRRLRRGSLASLVDNDDKDDDDDDTEHSTSTATSLSSSLKMPILFLKKSSSSDHRRSIDNNNIRTTQQQQQQHVKRVVFQHPKANKLYRNRSTCREECREQWYTANDYAQFKADAKLIATEIVKREKQQRAAAVSASSSSTTTFSYQGILQRVLQACRTHPYNMSSGAYDDNDIHADNNVGVSSSSSSSSSILTTTEQQHLQRWLDIATMRLGLEGMTIREIGRDRLHRRQYLQKVVLQAQADIRRAVKQQRKKQKQRQQPYQACVVHVSNNRNNDSHWFSESQARHLQNVSQSVSQPSRLFAHEMGRAAAAAASSSSSSAMPSSKDDKSTF